MLGRSLLRTVSIRLPCRSCFAHVKFEEIDDDLKQYMHGRKYSERRDSVSVEILKERKKHQEKFSSTRVDPNLVRSIRQVNLGTKKQMEDVYQKIASQHSTYGGVDMQTNTAAGGFSLHVASASKDWPIFKHLLPEVVFAGHSNSGKSTLVNGLSGILPRKGPASISERAGWTDQICFYQLGKKPPVMTLVDFPGYGHAIATVDDRREWIYMTRNYLANRSIISRCCILVDCTRGLCHGDRSLMRYLNRMKIPWLIIMTKGDLLSPEELAASITIIRSEIVERNLIPVKPEKHSEEEWDTAVKEEEDLVEKSLETEKKEKKQKEKAKMKKAAGRKDSGASGSAGGGSDSSGVGVDAVSDVEVDLTGLTYDDEDSYLDALPAQTENLKEKTLKSSSSGSSTTSTKKKKLKTANEVSTDNQSEETEKPEEAEAVEDKDGVTILPVSANTGAGVQALWKKLCTLAREDSKSGGLTAVREHRRADFQRKRARIDKMLAMAKEHNITMVKKKSPVIKK